MAAKNRNPEEKTPEELFASAKKAHRNATPRHVVKLEPKLTERQQRIALHISKSLGDVERRIVADMSKRLKNLQARKAYHRLRKQYRASKDALDQAKAKYAKLKKALDEKGQPITEKQQSALDDLACEIDVFEDDLEDKKNQLDALVKLEGISKKQCEKIASGIATASKYPISAFAQAVAEDVWGAVEKVLYGDAKKIHAKGKLRSIRAKQADKALVIKNDDGKLVISNYKGIGKFGFEIDPKDTFLVEEVAAILAFLEDKETEKRIVEYFMETGVVTEDTFRPVFATIKIEKIRGRWRFFCYITVEGHAKPKKKKDGAPRHDWSKTGKIGLDQGPSTYAACCDDLVEMKNLAERNGKSTFESEAKERRLQRKMDRSRRANNPQNYNDDGTVKKGKKVWKNSKTYQHDREKLADLRRKNAASRKYAIQEDVNRLREHGNVIVTEKQSIKGLVKKAKRKKKVDKKTGKARDVRRKRFGKSSQHRASGLFRAEAKKKFDEYIEVELMYRASQYDHETDTYVKKPLSQRTHHHSKGRASPRDAYSSFLLWCSDDEYTRVDRALCIIRFENYYDRVQAMIADYKERGVKVLNSGF